MTYLKEILIFKKDEIKRIDENSNLVKPDLKKTKRDRRSLFKNIKNGKINVIAEIKKASPSRGIINEQLDVRDTVIAYNKFKSFICGISVLTEALYFKGDPEYIRIAKKNSELPVLRKDFIFSEKQIYQSAALGADCVLLISSLLGRRKLKKLYDLAVRLGLDVLVEIHKMEDLEKAMDTGTRLIGINNRNLQDMSVDGKNIYNFLDYMQREDLKGKVLICESGIEDTGYIKDLFLSGLNTFLIGGYFMASENLLKTLKDMELELREKKLIR